ETSCITVANIGKLIVSKYSWYYQACHQCPKVARGDLPSYKCKAQHLIECEIFRYKIPVEVVYAGIKCKFVLRDRESEQLLGLSAAQMCNTMIEESEITSELNPNPVTPTPKRSTPDGSSESTNLSKLANGELSSNKLNKMIKIEK
ncbi:hypothetical protein RYX36_010366, partial [Vicia faba]